MAKRRHNSQNLYKLYNPIEAPIFFSPAQKLRKEMLGKAGKRLKLNADTLWNTETKSALVVYSGRHLQ